MDSNSAEKKGVPEYLLGRESLGSKVYIGFWAGSLKAFASSPYVWASFRAAELQASIVE